MVLFFPLIFVVFVQYRKRQPNSISAETVLKEFTWKLKQSMTFNLTRQKKAKNPPMK